MTTARLGTALLAVAVAVVVAVAPVAAVSSTVVLSIHTTNADFNNAATLENVTVSADTVSYDSAGQGEQVIFSDDFEDGDASGWTGDTSRLSAQTGTVFDGTYSAQLDGDGVSNYAVEEGFAGNETLEIVIATRYEDPSDGNNEKLTFGTGRYINTRVNGGSFENYDGTWTSVTTVSPDTWYVWRFVINSTSGTYDLYKNGTLVGDDLNMESASPVDTISVETVDDDVFFDNVSVTNLGSQVPEKPRGIYVSDTHTVRNATSAFADITLNANATAIITVENSTGGGGWNTLNSTTYTTGGNKSLTFSRIGAQEDYRVNVTFYNETGNGLATGTLEDEGIKGLVHPPKLSDPRPSGEFPSRSQTLKVNVSDVDFPDDTVTVDFYVDGSVVGSDTLTSDGVASYTHSFSGSGEWHAEAYDSYDATANASTPTQSISVPGYLNIYNESAPDSLVNDRTVNATFFSSNGTVYSRTTNTGAVDLANLPTSLTYVAQLDADNYTTRHVSMSETGTNFSVFMLPVDEPSVNVTFSLTDQTGNFPEDNTTLILQRALNQSGTLKYRTITSDVFGAGGRVKTTLAEGKRFRVIVRNRQGDTRTLGPYVADRDEEVPLEIGALTFSQQTANAYQIDTNYQQEPNGPDVMFNFTDPTNETSSLRVIVTNRSDGSVVSDQTFTDLGTVQVLEARGKNDTASYTIEWEGTRDGRAFNGSRIVGPTRSPGIPLSSMWQETFAAIFLIVVAGGLTGVNPTIAAVGTSLIGGMMWFIGWLPGVVGAGVIALALLISAAGYAERGSV